ncbi:MAG: hypothetical protein OIF55_17165 [Amphritea sp.]|nr:hypothetical protein [Amphritea sp.]
MSLSKIGLTLLLLSFSALLPVHAEEHGEMRVSGQNTEIWDQTLMQWIGVERFWLNYAESKGGLTWGRGSEYPEYSQVREFDLFLVELEQGNCLMEFFHNRWRRANDVRRWNDQLNHYGGCPHVFD